MTSSVSVQRIDPLGTLDGRPVALAAAISIFVFAVVMTWHNSADITGPLWAVAAVLFVALTSLVIVVATGPLRPPFSRSMHLAAVFSAVIAFACSSVSIGHIDDLMSDYWAPIVIGVTCMTLAPYRPVSELLIVGVAASVLVGLIAVGEAPVAGFESSSIVAALFSPTPVLAMSFGGAAFARSLVLSHQRWESRARTGARRQREREHVSVARSVQQDRITILNRDVVPLFTELSERGIVSPEDRARAAEYSASLRLLMVTEVNRSWLEAVVASSFGALDDGNRVRDPHRLASGMTAHQRTALRAAVLAVATGGELVRDSVRLAIEKSPSGAVIIVHAIVASSESSWRSSLAPYFAVLRVVFTGLQISYNSPSLIVRFTYDTP